MASSAVRVRTFGLTGQLLEAGSLRSLTETPVSSPVMSAVRNDGMSADGTAVDAMVNAIARKRSRQRT